MRDARTRIAHIARIRGEGDRMRRVLRHFFTVCSALSLLLCVAVGALWVRSYARGSACVVWRVGTKTTLVAQSKNGRIWFQRWQGDIAVNVRTRGRDVAWEIPERGPVHGPFITEGET